MLSLSHGAILAVFFRASTIERINGARWYTDALEFCRTVSAEFSLNVETVAGIVAALSPNNKWERNLTDAHAICRHYVAGGYDVALAVKCGTFNNNKIKALSILEGRPPLEILGGLKVRAFFLNIMGDPGSVCVDGHAYSIWTGGYIPTTQTPKISPKLYASISADYIQATADINKITGNSYLPYQTQAITWLAWRRLIHEAKES